MQELTHQQFETHLRKALGESFNQDRIDDVVRVINNRLHSLLPQQQWDKMRFTAADLGTGHAFYDMLSEKLDHKVDILPHLEADAMAVAIEKAARRAGMNMWSFKNEASLHKVRVMLDGHDHRESIASYDYSASHTPYTPAPKATVRDDTPRTPKAMIRKLPKPAPEEAEVPEPRQKPEPRAKVEPIQPRAKIVPKPKIEKKPAPVQHRAMDAIQAEFESAWGEVAQAAADKGVRNLITLTDAKEPAPWLHARPEKFKSNMDNTRATARDFGMNVKRLLDRVEGLYNEFHAAREQGAGLGR